MDPVSRTAQVTEDGVAAMGRDAVRWMVLRPAWLVLCAVLLLVGAAGLMARAAGLSWLADPVWIVWLTLPCVFAVATPLLTWRQTRVVVRRMIAANFQPGSTVRLELADQGVTVTTAASDDLVPWSTYRSAHLTDAALLLRFGGANVTVIPAHLVDDQVEAALRARLPVTVARR